MPLPPSFQWVINFTLLGVNKHCQAAGGPTVAPTPTPNADWFASVCVCSDCSLWLLLLWCQRRAACDEMKKKAKANLSATLLDSTAT